MNTRWIAVFSAALLGANLFAGDVWIKDDIGNTGSLLIRNKQISCFDEKGNKKGNLQVTAYLQQLIADRLNPLLRELNDTEAELWERNSKLLNLLVSTPSQMSDWRHIEIAYLKPILVHYARIETALGSLPNQLKSSIRSLLSDRKSRRKLNTELVGIWTDAAVAASSVSGKVGPTTKSDIYALEDKAMKEMGSIIVDDIDRDIQGLLNLLADVARAERMTLQLGKEKTLIGRILLVLVPLHTIARIVSTPSTSDDSTYLLSNLESDLKTFNTSTLRNRGIDPEGLSEQQLSMIQLLFIPFDDFKSLSSLLIKNVSRIVFLKDFSRSLSRIGDELHVVAKHQVCFHRGEPVPCSKFYKEGFLEGFKNSNNFCQIQFDSIDDVKPNSEHIITELSLTEDVGQASRSVTGHSKIYTFDIWVILRGANGDLNKVYSSCLNYGNQSTMRGFKEHFGSYARLIP